MALTAADISRFEWRFADITQNRIKFGEIDTSTYMKESYEFHDMVVWGTCI